MNDGVGNPKQDDDFRHADPVTDAAMDWFVRLQECPSDARLRAQAQAWLESDPHHKAAFDKLAALWDMPELSMASENLARRLDAEDRRALFQAAPPRRAFGRWKTQIAAIAAVLVLVAGIQTYPSAILRWKADYLTAAGEQKEITLPDGSMMTINTDSAVALDFEGGQRAVTLLRGEAFFDVLPDPQRPFTVAGAFGEVVVKGTAFSVRTGEQDVVVLERGRVEVQPLGHPEGHMVLKPGETISVSGQGLSVISQADIEDALAWRSGWIIFRDRPLGEVVANVGRYYQGRVVSLDSAVWNTRVSGNYRLSDPEAVIRSLAQAAGASAVRLPGGLIVLR